MDVIEFFDSDRPEHWLDRIGHSDWRGGRYLYELLRDHRLKALYGERAKVLLLTDGDALLSFCTYAERDDISDPSLTPWVGFVYTFPTRRGQRLFGRLLSEAERLGREDGFDALYISTSHIGLYEKYGCEFYATMTDVEGGLSRVYRKRL